MDRSCSHLGVWQGASELTFGCCVARVPRGSVGRCEHPQDANGCVVQKASWWGNPQETWYGKISRTELEERREGTGFPVPRSWGQLGS